ncbi:hypothetical protein GCM10022217_00990 [Chryseobacterium ginsenosidimutans]
MKGNKRTIYYIICIALLTIILLADICFKIFNDGTKKYLSFFTSVLFLFFIIIESKRKNGKK